MGSLHPTTRGWARFFRGRRRPSPPSPLLLRGAPEATAAPPIRAATAARGLTPHPSFLAGATRPTAPVAAVVESGRPRVSVTRGQPTPMLATVPVASKTRAYMRRIRPQSPRVAPVLDGATPRPRRPRRPPLLAPWLTRGGLLLDVQAAAAPTVLPAVGDALQPPEGAPKGRVPRGPLPRVCGLSACEEERSGRHAPARVHAHARL